MILCVRCELETVEAVACDHCGASPLVDGRYRLLEVLGRGANATTYRAQRVDDGVVVALKELLVRDAESFKVLELFEREAKVLEQLDHPGVPAYHEDLTTELGPHVGMYLAQQFVEGEPLSKRLEQGAMPPAEVVAVVRGVTEILSYLHGLEPPVVHRDIKPGNLIQRPDGRVVLVDFGSVRDAAVARSGDAPTVAGTLGYMAPEQLRGEASPASDVYGLGATAVALLTGRPGPEVLGDRDERWGDDLPLPLRRLLKAMLAARASNRPSLSRILEDLEDAPTSPTRGEAQGGGHDAGPLELRAAQVPRPLPANFRHQTFEHHGEHAKKLALIFGVPGVGVAIVVAWYTPLMGLGMALFYGFMAFVLWQAHVREARRRWLYARGAAVPGRVESVSSPNAPGSSRGDQSFRLFYSFEVDGVRIHGNHMIQDMRPDEIREGEDVLVFYDPEQPDDHLPLPALVSGPRRRM